MVVLQYAMRELLRGPSPKTRIRIDRGNTKVFQFYSFAQMTNEVAENGQPAFLPEEYVILQSDSA